MTWGDKGSNDQGPWGKPRPSGSGGNNQGSGKRPPGGDKNDFDDLFRKGQDQFKNMFGGNGSGNDGDGKKAGIMVVIAGAVLWLASGFYTVDTNEQGVILRFGEYHRTVGPGLHYHMPFPVERVFTPMVTDVNIVEIGQNRRNGRIGAGSDNENLMLTGDLNIVDINFTVQWKIDSSHTDDFLFNIRRAEQIVKPVAESAMREVIGQMPLQRIITDAQIEISDRTKEIMQQMVNAYNAGIQIVAVNLSKPDVPPEVIDAFQDVKRAEQEKNTLINKAEAYENEIIPKARGKAVKAEQQALAYKREVTEQAKGDAARFLSVYEEYRQAKDITKKRLYLETMEEILTGMNKFIIDGEGSKNMVPYLPLNEMNKMGGGR